MLFWSMGAYVSYPYTYDTLPLLPYGIRHICFPRYGLSEIIAVPLSVALVRLFRCP